MNPPLVCVIILNWNGLRDTLECLDSLRRITYPNHRVVLVDNGSEGEDVRVLKERFGDFIHPVETDRNYGVAEGRNIGIRYALASFHPDYLLFLDNDTVVAPEFLTEMVALAESRPDAGIVGPKVYLKGDSHRLAYVFDCIRMGRGIDHVGLRQEDRGQYDRVEVVDGVPGCCFLARREVIEKIGLFDVVFFWGFDENDYMLRTGRAGFRILYCHTARLWHRVTGCRTDVFSQYWLTRSEFHFWKKYASTTELGRFLVTFFSVGIAVSTVNHLRRRNLRGLLAFYRGVWHGVRLLFSEGRK